MFCEKCGAELLPDARFCTRCGAPVAPAESSVEWKAELKDGRIMNFSADLIPHLLIAIQKGEEDFFILSPPRLIEGSRYMQACSDDAGALHVELCMDRGAEKFEMFAINGIPAEQAAALFTAYYQQETVPVPLPGYQWELI